MIKLFGLVMAALLVVLTTLWGVLAIYFSNAAGSGIAIATVFALCGFATVISLIMQRRIRQTGAVYLVAFFALIVWWNSIEPSNDRNWQTDVAMLPYATINGDLITVHNIRNFDYRTETDYIPAYYDKVFDVRKLESVDLVAVYWMGPAIAHTFLSFGFEGGDYLAVSIETRKEQGEGYSTIKGFFKQYELYYVVADERDVIRLRTNYRKNPPEDVYIYRIKKSEDNERRLFLEYLRKINALRESPKFYNTLLHNCTTTIWLNTRINPGHLPFSWKLLASGYVPEYLYEQDRLDTTLTFSDLQRSSHINERAQAADKAEDFSRRIRVGDG